METETVIVGWKKQPDAPLNAEMEALWNSARLFLWVGDERSFPWQELQRKLQKGEGVVIQNLAAILYSGKRRTSLYAVYRRLGALLDEGHTVAFAEEGLLFGSTDCDAWGVLAALGRCEQAHEADAVQRRGGSNVANVADEQTLAQVRESLERHDGKVKAVCEEIGIARTTFYRWRNKGWFDYGDPDGEPSKARRGRAQPSKARLETTFEAIRRAGGNVSRGCREAGERRTTVHHWIKKGFFEAVGLDMKALVDQKGGKKP